MFSMIGTIESFDGMDASDGGRVLILGLPSAEAAHLVFEGPMAVRGSVMGLPEFALVVLASAEDEEQITERLAEFMKVHFEFNYVDEGEQGGSDGPAR